MNVSGLATLQFRSSTSGQVEVTPTWPGVSAMTTAGDAGNWSIGGVPRGTYTVAASAPGFLAAELTGVVVGGSDVNLGATQLAGGDVNVDGFVNINDITATVASFGATLVGCADALGCYVDLNCNSFGEINDVTGTVSNFGKASPQSW